MCTFVFEVISCSGFPKGESLQGSGCFVRRSFAPFIPFPLNPLPPSPVHAVVGPGETAVHVVVVLWSSE